MLNDRMFDTTYYLIGLAGERLASEIWIEGNQYGRGVCRTGLSELPFAWNARFGYV